MDDEKSSSSSFKDEELGPTHYSTPNNENTVVQANVSPEKYPNVASEMQIGIGTYLINILHANQLTKGMDILLGLLSKKLIRFEDDGFLRIKNLINKKTTETESFVKALLTKRRRNNNQGISDELKCFLEDIYDHIDRKSINNTSLFAELNSSDTTMCNLTPKKGDDTLVKKRKKLKYNDNLLGAGGGIGKIRWIFY